MPEPNIPIFISINSTYLAYYKLFILFQVKTSIKPGPYVVHCSTLNGRLFLSSVASCCIFEVEEQFGCTQAVYGSKGCPDPGKLLGPSKIYSDDLANAMVVCDFGNHRFQVVKPGGTRKCPAEKACWLLIRPCVCLSSPVAAAMDDDGFMWVAEKEGALYKFSYPPEKSIC